MKLIQFIPMAILMVFTISCSAEANNEKENKETIRQAENVTVYYFHNTRRCTTCKTVESVTKQAVEKLDNSKVVFAALNLEEPAGKEKANELGISGQTLLIVGGEKKYNITQEGFLHARSNPEKLEQLIQEKINSLL
jgi:thiol-disulfide isomerase/thioredoxin